MPQVIDGEGFEKMLLKRIILMLIAVLTVSFAASVHAAETLVINEFLASNSSSGQDPQGQYDDWIEIYNYGTNTIDMAGMYLTDDFFNPTKWQFPAGTSIHLGDYLIIWADEDTSDAGLHANFKLNAGGEQIALFDSDGTTLIDNVTFGAQRTDISYGRYPDGSDQWRFFGIPSPDDENEGGYLDTVADTKFSHDRGFYDEPFYVTISTATAGAAIRYTTDGSAPDETYGQIYSGPVHISTSTCLRAMAYKSGWKPTNVDTQTYIFLDDVVEQTGSDFPNTWGHLGADYEMDQVVVGNYYDTIRDDLKSIPTVSLVMDVDDWFNGSSSPAVGGIYANPDWEDRYGEEAERIVSVEFFDPAGEMGQFQLNAGVRIVGGSSTNPWKSDKLSMRLKFQEQYGPTRLIYPLFGEGAAESFDTLVLDARLNNAWNYGNDNGQRERAQYTRDQFTSDLQNALGGYGHNGLHVHLYLNGLYWGLYNLHERPDESFAASYLGGNKEDYDVLKHSSGTIVSGSGTNYNEMFGIANSGLSSDSQYQLIQEYLDVPDFISYMITNFYVGNTDWAHHNWYASRNIADANGQWRYHSWDAEHVMKGLNDNVTGKNNDGGPTRLHQRLKANTEYIMQFADQVHRHFFNDGPLTIENVTALYQLRLDEVDRAVVGESARWGDNRIEQAGIRYTRDEHWIDERNWFLTTYFPNRTRIVLNQFTSAGLYPNVDAPVFYIDGSYQHGGRADTDSIFSMADTTGTIYYSLDGTDPRLPITAGPGNQVTLQVTLVPENAPKRVLVPTGTISNNWTGGGTFNDQTWASGTGGIGYERNSGYQQYIDLDTEEQMYGENTTCYIRIPFTLDAGEYDFSSLTLKIRYDDGFIAYLNGTEVTIVNFNGTPDWNSTASDGHEAAAPEYFDISNYIDELNSGENILAIHGLNASPTSSDFLISAELVAVTDGSSPDSDLDVPTGVIQYTAAITLTESAHIKARALIGRIWSALNEATYAVGPVAENLRITEIMYHPQTQTEPNDPNEEFIELTNIGAETINLNLVKFTNGINFTFPSVELAPGEYIVVVQDIEAFEARYGTQVNIAGQYSASLANGGERIRLEDAVGQTILDFTYKDGWHYGTDGLGYSLVIINPTNPDPDSWDDKDSWHTGSSIGGSPGREE